MYAVIATGGKQYRVEKNSLLKVEKLDAEPGSTVQFSEVLLIADGADIKVGKPHLAGSKVSALSKATGRAKRRSSSSSVAASTTSARAIIASSSRW
jgi:large subunit ribosomal protein L21